MKFVVNRYSIDVRSVMTDPPPIPGAPSERHPFGVPPYEMREVWVVEIEDLDGLLALTRRFSASIEVGQSGYWSGSDIANPGSLLFGIALVDDPEYQIDPRDRPTALVRKGLP